MRRSSSLETLAVAAPDAVRRKLAELGIPCEILSDAIRQGALAGSFTTAAHPVWYPGSKTNGETTGALRAGLATLGWTNNDDDNIARAVSPDGAVVVSVLSGNARTGLCSGPHAQPRRKRGEASIRLIRRNYQIAMVELLPVEDRERVKSVVETFGPTWFLLYYRDGDTVRCELSLARGVTSEGDLIQWSERLILPDVDMLAPTSRDVAEVVGEPIEIDVPVERRQTAS